MNMMVEQAYEDKVLDETFHHRLVQNLEQVAKAANIPVPVICQSATGSCSEDELYYLRNLRAQPLQGIYGLVLEGKKPLLPVNQRMMAMAGACLRNYIDARVIVIQDLLTALKEQTMEEPTVLLIPNFHASKKQGGTLPDWQISQLLGMLYKRQLAGLQTIMYIESMNSLHQEYGEVFKTHLQQSFTIIPA